MKSYSETDVFNRFKVLKLATRYVELFPSRVGMGELVRCHEVARAVKKLLEFDGVVATVYDGKCGAVEHSWLVIDRKILDVYVCGRLPQVQLVDPTVLLPNAYHIDTPRKDINEAVVKELFDDAMSKLHCACEDRI